MAFRKQDARAFCRDCRETAIAACKRCEALLCREHRPARRQRCSECEDEFASKTRALEAKPAVAALYLKKTSRGYGAISAIGLLAGTIALVAIQLTQADSYARFSLGFFMILGFLTCFAGALLSLGSQLGGAVAGLTPALRRSRANQRLRRRLFLRERPKKRLLAPEITSTLERES